MNKKIIISLSIIVAVGAIVIGATTSYFSNTETSAGNTFIAGAIDLKIDNECHLNGRVCADGYWQGTSEPCDCTWGLSDLDGKAIFSFLDVKPGDDGEDTISLHVDTNPAWICAEISNVTQNDNGCNPPEFKAEEAAYGVGNATCGTGEAGIGKGELWGNLNFNIWMDNGAGEGHKCNNIKDEDESYLVQNANVENLQYAIADSKTGGSPIRDACIGVEWSVPAVVNNIAQTDSVTGDITFKAYQARHNENFVCYALCGNGIVEPGEECDGSAPEHYACVECKLVFQPYCGDGQVGSGETCELPNTSDNPFCIQTSSKCDGTKTQTRDGLGSCGAICGCVEDPFGTPVCVKDSCGATCAVDADCDDYDPNTTDTCSLETCGCSHDILKGTLTVNKVLDPASDSGKFNLQIDGSTVAADQGNGGTTGAQTYNAGSVHTFGEIGGTGTDLNNYTTVLGGDADCTDGSVTIVASTNITCTITNTRIAHLTINKVLIPSSDPGKFNLQLNGYTRATDVGDGGTTGVINVSPGGHTVGEIAGTGTNLNNYTTVIGGDCPSSGNIVINTGDQKVCTITNTRMGTITVTKTVTNDDGGLLQVGSFTLRIDGGVAVSGVAKNVAVGAHTVDEDGIFGYTATFSGDCDSSGIVTVAAGENKSCTINNNDIRPSIRLIKIVSGGSALPDDFDLSIDGAIKTSGSSNPVLANTPHEIDEEVMVSGYSFTSITGTSYLGVSCPALQGTITLLPGDIVTCTITNTKP